MKVKSGYKIIYRLGEGTYIHSQNYHNVPEVNKILFFFQSDTKQNI